MSSGSTYPIKEIRERIRRWWFDRDFDESQWPDPLGDAVALGVIVTRLVEQVHKLNDASAVPQDLCPMCGDFKWGRPQHPLGGQNVSKRKCHDCGEIRVEWHVVSTKKDP